ncbi:MAG: macro domain-containing protein [Ruminococcaceae bacterium]|nr:macro domain-containing protein [Oscillospiraceae bacterium]
MPLKIIRQDITKIKADAIVNPTNKYMRPGGGTDAAIHKAAGKKLMMECISLGECPEGEARITKGYNLPSKYVIHTAGPVWRDGQCGEKEILESCYRECLNLAAEYKLESIAFPLISSGLYGFPKDSVLKIAIQVIGQFLFENEIDVYIVVFDKTAYQLSEKLFKDVTSYIDDNYVDEHSDCFARTYSMPSVGMAYSCPSPVDCCSVEKKADLDSMLDNLDESFSQMLLRKIDEKGMTDVQCYKKANINRKLFSKIRSDVNYKPSKPTVIAFAVSLELTLEETEEMLKKAGFALSHSNKFDIIIEFFITNGKYDIFEINETLFAFDQSLLGA